MLPRYKNISTSFRVFYNFGLTNKFKNNVLFTKFQYTTNSNLTPLQQAILEHQKIKKREIHERRIAPLREQLERLKAAQARGFPFWFRILGGGYRARELIYQLEKRLEDPDYYFTKDFLISRIIFSEQTREQWQIAERMRSVFENLMNHVEQFDHLKFYEATNIKTEKNWLFSEYCFFLIHAWIVMDMITERGQLYEDAYADELYRITYLKLKSLGIRGSCGFTTDTLTYFNYVQYGKFEKAVKQNKWPQVIYRLFYVTSWNEKIAYETVEEMEDIPIPEEHKAGVMYWSRYIRFVHLYLNMLGVDDLMRCAFEIPLPNHDLVKQF